METGWLIEKGYAGKLEAVYFGQDVDDPRTFGWTPDNLLAIRFARREDAELFSKLGKLSGYGLVNLRDPHVVVEHGWG